MLTKTDKFFSYTDKKKTDKFGREYITNILVYEKTTCFLKLIFFKMIPKIEFF